VQYRCRGRLRSNRKHDANKGCKVVENDELLKVKAEAKET
jgi:hypothetical protein